MAEHHFGKDAAAALVFLILYVLVFIWMTYAYFHKYFKVRSRWSLLYFHVIIRVASQACGVAFGVLAFDSIGVFTAYLVLAAEGFFTLVICSYRFLISWQQHNRYNQVSTLEPRFQSKADKGRAAVQSISVWPLIWIFTPWRIKKNPMVFIHNTLYVGNIVIIVGGSMLSGYADLDKTPEERENAKDTGSALRTTGQAVFLALNILFGLYLLHCVYELRNKKDFTGQRTSHPTLVLLVVAWVFLLVRGIWGVLQSAVWSLSYFSPKNYEADGFTSRFTAMENVLSVMTEWIPVVLLNLTFLTSRHDPPKAVREDVVAQDTSEEAK